MRDPEIWYQVSIPCSFSSLAEASHTERWRQDKFMVQQETTIIISHVWSAFWRCLVSFDEQDEWQVEMSPTPFETTWMKIGEIWWDVFNITYRVATFNPVLKYVLLCCLQSHIVKVQATLFHVSWDWVYIDLNSYLAWCSLEYFCSQLPSIICTP